MEYTKQKQCRLTGKGIGRPLLAWLFLVVRVAGVLPVQWNDHINHNLHLCGQETDCFSASTRWRLVTLLQLMLLVHFGHRQRLLPWSFHINSIISITWHASYLTAVCALSLVFFQSTELVKCCAIACKMSTLGSKLESIPSSSTFLLIYPFVTFIFLAVYILLENLSVDFSIALLVFNYEYLPNACVELVVAAMGFVASRAFDNMNKRMKSLDKYSDETFKCMIALINDHISVSKFSNRFGKHFSLHFINIFTIYVVQMVCYTVVIIRLIKKDNIIDIAGYGIHVCYITGRLFFLCYWCQQVKVKWCEFVTTFQRIRILWADRISHEEKYLLDGYEELMTCSEVEITACGLFPINLNQTLSVLGLIITYAMVALQTK